MSFIKRRIIPPKFNSHCANCNFEPFQFSIITQVRYKLFKDLDLILSEECGDMSLPCLESIVSEYLDCDDIDFRLYIFKEVHTITYQRHAKNTWNLIEKYPV